MECAWAGKCSGCAWIQEPYQDQLQKKRDRLRDAWRNAGLNPEDLGPLPIQSLGECGLRDRVEMTLHRVNGQMRYGLYDVDRRHILDLTQCPQMSPAMVPLFQAFRADLPQLELGAARLRVAPNGDWGVWLHFPNLEIERFLKEEDWLNRWLPKAHLEMGQRRQSVQRGAAGLNLSDPEPKPWFQTYLNGQPHPLYCQVGSFTQPGYRANAALVDLVQKTAARNPADHWLELGAGIGNFTLPLAASGASVTAIDNDPAAIKNLDRAAAEAGLSHGIQATVLNMHHRNQPAVLDLHQFQAVLADPPRSGLRAFAGFIARAPIHQLLYVSCFGESLAADTAVLTKAGFAVQSMVGLDQFPQSPHCEWVALLTRAETC